MPKYGRINLDIVAISGDSIDDTDSIPQVDLVSGTATISATLRSGSADISGIDGLTEKKIQLPQPITCTIADGKLTRSGHQHVTLLSPSTTWTWQISFDDLYVGNVPLVLDTFTFPVEPATEAQLADTSWHGTSIAPFAAERYSGESLSQAAVARMVEILDDAMPKVVDVLAKYPTMQGWYEDMDTWQAQVATDRQIAHDASALAVLAASQAGRIMGTGSPEGNRDAPIGTIYVDTANGIFYAKTSAEGVRTGWGLLYGDTGWRNISANVLEGQGWYNSPTVYIRRLNNFVIVQLNGQQNQDASNEYRDLFVAPGGFRPAYSGFATTWRGARVHFQSGGPFRVASAGTTIDYGTFTFPAQAIWPTTLPGTPT